MLKQGLIIGLFLASCGLSSAQKSTQVPQDKHQHLVEGVERCNHEHVIDELAKEDPDFHARRAAIKAQTQQWIATQAQHQAGRAVITVPVVVHVIYRTANQNISMAQIQSQIDVLNDDYRRLNADASNTPTSFQGIAADSEIEFCLANSDPNGDLTDGVTRTSTTVTNIGSTNSYYRTNQGGHDIWDRNLYLNIWVCELNQGLLGFATPPGANAQRDGIVVDHVYFGTTGTAQAPFNGGRTLTHEIGHWLDLPHIWGNGCNVDDGVSDTPDQASPYYNCPSFPQTSCNTQNMFMNYMDYVNDNCMNMFTQGQAAIMQATLNGPRSSILSSNGCAFGCNIIELSFETSYCGDTTGEVTASATGGVAPYSFQWDAGTNNQLDATANSLLPGTYAVTVTDADGCSRQGSVSFVGNGALLQVQLVTANSIGSACNGSAATIVSGGTPPYTYLWSSGASSSNAFNLCDGNVSVTVTDAANCEMTFSDTVGSEPPVGLTEWLAENLRIFPNPTKNEVTLSGLPAEGVTLEVFDLMGKQLSSVFVNGQSSYQIPLSSFGAGTYLVSINANNTNVVRRVVVF